MIANTKHLASVYLDAKARVLREGYAKELEWQRGILGAHVSEARFLRESAWVILCSGFRENTVRKLFSNFSLCFCDWESSAAIVEKRELCISAAHKVFKNHRKVEAIADIAALLDRVTFEEFWLKVAIDPVVELRKLPHIGQITTYHLAKNLGFNVSKPDRHLVRIASSLGFDCVHQLCDTISQISGDAPSVVDLVLWRNAVLSSANRL